MGKPSASGLQRVLECTASVVLPGVHTSGIHAERGTAIAAFIRRAMVGGVDAALKLVPVDEWRETCRTLDWRKLCGDLSDVRGEMAYALDVSAGTARELGSNLGRKYPATGPSEIVGTCDIEGMRIDGVPVVADVKTGLSVTPCEENAQIKYFALVTMLRTGAPEVEGRILYLREDGDVLVDPHTFTAFDLESFRDELGEMLARVRHAEERSARGETLTVYGGEHCKYCPAMQACPRFTALARAMVTDLPAVKTRLAMMPPEEQGRAWVLANDIEKLLEDVQTSLKEIAREHPIPLPNGQVVKETRSTATSFDRETALAMLRARGATEEEIHSLYTSTPTKPVKAVGSTKGASARKRKAA